METNNLTAPIAVEKDRNTLTIELMNRMKLHGMAAAFTESLTSTMAETMTIDSFLHMLLAREWDYRANAAIQRLIRGAAFRSGLELIDMQSRGLGRNQMERLCSLGSSAKGQSLFITGSSGTGKTSASAVVIKDGSMPECKLEFAIGKSGTDGTKEQSGAHFLIDDLFP